MEGRRGGGVSRGGFRGVLWVRRLRLKVNYNKSEFNDVVYKVIGTTAVHWKKCNGRASLLIDLDLMSA